MKYAPPLLFTLAFLGMLGLAALRSNAATPVPSRAHPGSDTALLSPSRLAELEAIASERLSRGIEPRTRHLAPDGSPLFTNRLIETSSPYLHQHAHNPVNWFPWGDEAFERAKTLDRPILLSIGYATCHWCHVMEEESFEDLEIAAWINEHFVPIKVDRETRPDIDRVYMSAVTLSLGRGGWPATLVLHPDKRPFFAATYLPARDGDRGRSKGFLTVLKQIAGDWSGDRSQLESLADRLTQAVRRDLDRPGNSALPDRAVIEALLERATTRYDPVNGGTERAPKFPSTFPVRLMLADGSAKRRSMATHTLDRMAAGGMYDQVGGGFHRYSTDAHWGIPHFEKMLYDNALLARAYGEAFQITGDLRYARIVDETLGFMQRDLKAPAGGFCSALDADSKRPDGEVEEGWFYSWTPAELDAALGSRSTAFQRAYSVTSKGNFEGRNVLHFTDTPTLEQRDSFREDRLALELLRRQRPPPLRDDKVLTAWNGLAIGALAYNGWLMGRDDWVEEARATATLLLDARVDGRLARVVDGNRGEGTAFLDDYAFLAEGLVTLFEATGERRWLDEAIALSKVAETHYGDADGAWFRTPTDHEQLLTRERPTYDQAIPSANSIWVAVFLRLSALTGDDVYRQRADQLAAALPITQHPTGFPNALLGIQGQPLREIVLVTNPGERSSGMHAAIKTLAPNRRVFVQQTAGEAPVVPLSADKLRLGKPTVYVCQGGVCDRPLTDPEQLAALLAR